MAVGRLQVSARAVSRAALEYALTYATERENLEPIWRHQLIGTCLADMATELEVPPQLTQDVARRAENVARDDRDAGMATLNASETAMGMAVDAVRIHGGYGFSIEFEIERNLIARQLIKRGSVAP